MLSTINYLHTHQIIYRDIKPENIVLANEDDLDSLKLIDFGTAERIDSNRIFNIPLGTIYYVAPEVLRRSYSTEADVWSCGIVFYLMLCGYPPFNGDDDFQIVSSIL